MKLKVIVTTMAICIITIGGLNANANQRGGYGYGPPTMSDSDSAEKDWHGQQRSLRRELVNELLGLSEEQQKQINAIREEEQTTNEALRVKMRGYREQMRELTSAGTFDENEFRVIAENKAETQVELAVSRARMHNRINAIMTTEQQELSQKIRSLQHNKRGGQRRGSGGGHPVFP